MRLRQVALAAHDLDGITDAFARAFGLKVAFNDPHIIHYGLKNAVLPAGTGFLEVVQPVKDDASAGRFLARRGGDAGYMVILQCADMAAERARAVALGVRVVDDLDNATYRAAHFHPADFGGVLVSFDQQKTAADFLEPYGDWMPAGDAWRACRTDEIADLASVTIAAADPDALARRWAELIGRPLDAADARRLPLDHGEVRFVAGASTSLAGVGLKARDPAAVLARARAAGLPVDGEAATIGGVRFAVTGA